MVPVATRPYGGYEHQNSSPTKPDELYRPHRDDELLSKIAGVPVASRPFGVDEYKHGSPKKANPARDDDKPHDLITKRTMVPVGIRPKGREYERSFPTAQTNPARHDIDNKWHGTQKPQANPSVIWTEWRRLPRSAGYNGNEEEPEAIDSNNRISKPINNQGWSSFPRNGAQLSEATKDINKAAERFIQAARLSRASEGEYKASKPSAKNAFPIPNDNDSRDRRNVGEDRPTPTLSSNLGLDSSIDPNKRVVTIDSREAEKKYNGKRIWTV